MQEPGVSPVVSVRLRGGPAVDDGDPLADPAARAQGALAMAGD